MTHEPANTIPETDRALDRLNAVERDLLGLLGRGHTAKSIATLRSMSEAAVNERFRSARRKTGIGSSREIARLIVAQENRHDFIGLARTAAAPPELRRPEAPRRASPDRWRLLMAAAILIAAAILAQQTSIAPTEPALERQVPTAAEAFLAVSSTKPDIPTLHAEVMDGGVDAAWSPSTEAALAGIYDSAIENASALASFDITCSASLCEALGVSHPGLTDDALRIFNEAIGAPDVHRAGVALGLHPVMHGFTETRDNSANGEPSVMIFAAYWRRVD